MSDRSPEFADVPFETILECCNLKSIEHVASGPGWCGNRYMFHSYNYGSFGPFWTMQEMRERLIQEFYWRIRDKVNGVTA